MPHSMRNLSSKIRDQTHVPWAESLVLTTGQWWKSLIIVFKPSWSQVFHHHRKIHFTNSRSLTFFLFLTAIWVTNCITVYNFLYLLYSHNFCSLFFFLRYVVKYFFKLTSDTHVSFYNIQHSVHSLLYSFYISYDFHLRWNIYFSEQLVQEFLLKRKFYWKNILLVDKKKRECSRTKNDCWIMCEERAGENQGGYEKFWYTHYNPYGEAQTYFQHTNV